MTSVKVLVVVPASMREWLRNSPDGLSDTVRHSVMARRAVVSMGRDARRAMTEVLGETSLLRARDRFVLHGADPDDAWQLARLLFDGDKSP